MKSFVRSIGIRISLISLLLSVFTPGFAAADPLEDTFSDPPVARAVSIDPNTIVQEDFLGIGVNLIPTALMESSVKYGYTDAHWQMDRKRILALQPKVARVWFQIDWMEEEKGIYTWDSEKMQAFYEYLDVLQEAGTEVEFNFGWKAGEAVHDWFSMPGVDPVISAPLDLDAYAESASAVLQELILNRGYTNIKYLALYNEPNGFWDFETPDNIDQQAYYAEMLETVSEQLEADEIRDLVEIWAPEETSADWTEYMKDNVDEHIDGYSFHIYGDSYENLSTAIAARRDAAGTKPIHMTEFGWPNDEYGRWDSGYANYVIKAANEGVKSALIWQLNGMWTTDPEINTNGDYSLWDPLFGDPKKAYYAAGLLMRYVPAHSDVIEVETDSPDIRAAAFKTSSGDYTIVVESKEGDAKNITFDFNNVAINKTFNKIVYKQDFEPDANALLPTVADTIEVASSYTDSVDDDYTFVVYTTLAPETQVELIPARATVASGDTLTLAADVIDNEDGVAWSVVGGNVNGSITNAGVYTAPAVTTEKFVAIKALSVEDPSSFAISLVKVVPTSTHGVVDAPVFSLEPGVYDTAEVLFMTTTTPGAEIRYTKDLSEPTVDSELYTGPIILKENSFDLYKAKAFKAGETPSGLTAGLYKVHQKLIGPDGYSFCMYGDIGAECEFEGEASVAYGSDGLFNYGTYTDSVSCSTLEFGDPNPGQEKRCYYSYEIPDEPPVITIFNGGFEKPDTDEFARWGPFNMGWQFSERSGVQHNNGPFQPTAAPQGVQTAWLQTNETGQGYFQQSINFKPGTYELSFKAALRLSYGGAQTFAVYFDDELLGNFKPKSGQFKKFKTDTFTTTGGWHVIKFVATTTSGDNTAFIDDIKITYPTDDDEEAGEPDLVNGNFEEPYINTDVELFRIGPFSAGWDFNNKAGVQPNDSPFGAEDAPDGTQTAVLQTGNGIQGVISQDVYFSRGSYSISFKAAGRTNYGGLQTFDVLVDDQVIGSYAPTSVQFIAMQTENFTVTQGYHTISFVATSDTDGDNTAYIDDVRIGEAAYEFKPELLNAGFESPDATGDGYKFGQMEYGWTFDEYSGVHHNGGPYGMDDAPEGVQAALLQTRGDYNTGQFSQNLYLRAGKYVLSFDAAMRTSYGGQQTFDVYVDDEVVGSFEPDSGEFTSYETDPFTVTGGTHVLKFVATAETGDNTAYIDDVKLTFIPPSSSLKSFVSFGLNAPIATGVIDDAASTIVLTVPHGTDVNTLVPVFTTDHAAAQVLVNGIAQVSGVTTQDFTNPVTYTVQAEDESTRTYTVTVNVQPPLSTAKAITSFGFATPSAAGTINESNHTIAVTVPYGTNLTNMAPEFTTTGVDVKVGSQSQISGVSTQDFTNSVTYSVYAEDASTQDYVVMVTVAARSPSSDNDPPPWVPPEPESEPESKTPATPAPIYKSGINPTKVVEQLKAKIDQARTAPVSQVLSDTDKHWSKPNIDLFVKLGFITGYQDGTFRPDASITRGEFTAIIAKVFNLEVQPGRAALKDVKDTHWAKSMIEAAVSNGIIRGYTDGTFRPNQAISRAEMIAIIGRIVDLNAVEKNQTISYNDVSGSWNADEIQAAAASGIIEGRDAGTFAPAESSTRAEALTIILRVLNLNPELKSQLDQLRS